MCTAEPHVAPGADAAEHWGLWFCAPRTDFGGVHEAFMNARIL